MEGSQWRVIRVVALLAGLLTLGGCSLLGWLQPVHYIAGYHMSILSSSDGDEWSREADLSQHGILLVAANDERFVAIDETGASWYSDNGRRWRAGGTVGAQLRDIAVGHTGRFVVVGAGIWYSDDGEQWTRVSGLSLTGELTGVSYGGGHFIALQGGHYAFNSSDGSTWSGPFLAGGDFIAHSDTGRAVTLAMHATGSLYSDDNGETWTDTGAWFSSSWGALTYGDGRFVAVEGNTPRVYHSAEGLEWTLAGSIPYERPQCNDIAFGDGRFIVVGMGDPESNVESGIWYSDDGAIWHWATPDRRNVSLGGFSVAYRE